MIDAGLFYEAQGSLFAKHVKEELRKKVRYFTMAKIVPLLGWKRLLEQKGSYITVNQKTRFTRKMVHVCGQIYLSGKIYIPVDR